MQSFRDVVRRVLVSELGLPLEVLRLHFSGVCMLPPDSFVLLGHVLVGVVGQVWRESENMLIFTNSIKMKMAVIIGVTQVSLPRPFLPSPRTQKLRNCLVPKNVSPRAWLVCCCLMMMHACYVSLMFFPPFQHSPPA